MGKSAEQEQPKAPPLKRRHHRRPTQYAVLTINVLIALACFIGSGALVYGQRFLNNNQKTGELIAASKSPLRAPATQSTGSIDSSVATDPATTTTEPFPAADPHARNFLITGSDNGACDAPDTANPVGPRDTLGERSDTIMIMRVDPSTSRAAVLSLPRDLWVQIAGTNGKSRINSAYSLNQPQKLIDTIYLNFGIAVDHYIQIDFCAFKTLVDAVGGVSVPFQYAAMDAHTALDVPTPGCFNFDGAGALAYARSRHYMYLDPKTNTFKEDPASDFGRISRQQDFLRRAVAKVLSKGTFDLSAAKGLIDVAEKYVVTDPELTIGKQLEFAGILKTLNPDSLQTYQIESTGQTIGGAAVLIPRLAGDNMKAILAIFRGEAQLAKAPEQVFESTTTAVPRTTTTTAKPTTTTTAGATGPAPIGTTKPASTTSTTTTTTTAPTTTTSPLPDVSVAEIIRGIVPPKDVKC